MKKMSSASAPMVAILAFCKRTPQALKARHPQVPVIAFPRGAGTRFPRAAEAIGAAGIAIDEGVSAAWAAEHLQPLACVQGNLPNRLLVTGGEELTRQAQEITRALSGGPHIFNLGHGITPDADPENVALMIETIRGG